jgi:ribose transport system substrate-binding protein
LTSLALAGCGTKPAGGIVDNGKPTVAFVTNNPAEFWTIAQHGAEKGAKEFDVNLEFQMPPRGDDQRRVIEDLLAKGVQGMSVSPVDPVNQASFFDEVATKVPLLAHDNDLPPGSKRLAYIGTDNYAAGRDAGKLVKEAMPDGGKIAIYVGTLSSNAIGRRQGVLDELAGETDAKGPIYGKFTLIDTMTDETSQDKCKANVEDTIVKHGSGPETLGLVGLWAYNPPAMLAAVKGAGLVGKVKLIGFDENEETLQGVKDGAIQGTVVQNPFEFGYQAVKMLAAIARKGKDNAGIPADGIIHVPHRTIKADNVDEFWTELKRLQQ